MSVFDMGKNMGKFDRMTVSVVGSHDLDAVARRFFHRALQRVSWETCKVQGLRLMGDDERAALESAAAEYKAAGGEWEEWT